MGGFEALLSGDVDPTVKYHSVRLYILTCAAKRRGDSIWWVVLVGRYLSGRRRSRTKNGLARTSILSARVRLSLRKSVS